MISVVKASTKPDSLLETIWFFVMRTRKKIVILIGLTISLLAGCGSNSAHTYVFDGATMGTYYSVKVVSAESLNATQVSALDVGIASELDRINSLMSSYDDESELSRFNSSPIGLPFSLSAPTFDVLTESLALFESTGGAFDISVSSLVELWGFGVSSAPETTPNKAAITTAKAKVGLDRLVLKAPDLIAVKRGSLELNVSAIAKGYAVDQVARYLNTKTLVGYLVEVGGEISAAGTKASGKVWRVGIEVPARESRTAYATLALNERAIATSGDYRNFLDLDGRRYSHTIDPRTGYPVEHHLASVSVVADRCSTADALATALMVMGENEGYEYAQNNSLDALFIVRDGDEFRNKATGSLRSLVNR
jgi:thiamine biosynthesis lipoprotein